MGREAEADAALERSLALPEGLEHAPSLRVQPLRSTYVSSAAQARLGRASAPTAKSRRLRCRQEEGFRFGFRWRRLSQGFAMPRRRPVERRDFRALETFESIRRDGTGSSLVKVNVHALGSVSF